MNVPVPVEEVIRASVEQLSPAERRVAEVVTREPEVVAFGTVAQLARRAGTSGPTVVRLADRLGYQGFVGLQARIREELARRLRPATQRMRSQSRIGVLERVLAAEQENVRRTLAGLEEARLGRAVELLADSRARLFLLPSEQVLSLARHFATELQLLRDGVRLVHGSAFGVATRLAALARGDVVVAIDLRRHERWLLEVSQRLDVPGLRRVAITDSPLSPLADGADVHLTVSAASAGPFDSQVGMLALFNVLVAAIATRHRSGVTRRIDRLERAWTEAEALVEE